MQHMRFMLRLAAPLALLAGPALAQQGVVPPAGPDPNGASDTNQTRALENQIEEYPGPSDGLRDESDVDTRIPEQIHPPPKSNAAARPRAATPAAPAVGSGSANGAIDPSEVQRVFGRDTGVIALSSLDPASVTQLQMQLRERGYDPGPVDGVVGPKTRAALEGYARAQFTLKQRLLQQDQLTTDLAEQLGVAPGSRRGAEPSRRDGARPAPPGDAPLLPPGGAPLPPPGMAPLPTPSSAPSSLPAPRGGATPSTPPPSP